MLVFMVSDNRLGNVTETVNGKVITITSRGDWVDEEASWELLDKQYDIYCPALRGFKKQQGLFIGQPTADQIKGVN